MIYTVTLNPSIDYIVRLNSLVTGITNRTTGEEYYYGGKGINVSCVLAELDLESTAFGFVAGFTGDAIEKGIRNDKIITDFIKLESGISRINIKIKAVLKQKSIVRVLTSVTANSKDCFRKSTEYQTAIQL